MEPASPPPPPLPPLPPNAVFLGQEEDEKYFDFFMDGLDMNGDFSDDDGLPLPRQEEKEPAIVLNHEQGIQATNHDLSVGQCFDTREVLKLCVSIHASKNMYAYKNKRDTNRSYYVKCRDPKCDWHLKASSILCGTTWMPPVPHLEQRGNVRDAYNSATWRRRAKADRQTAMTEEECPTTHLSTPPHPHHPVTCDPKLCWTRLLYTTKRVRFPY